MIRIIIIERGKKGIKSFMVHRVSTFVTGTLPVHHSSEAEKNGKNLPLQYLLAI